MLHQIDMQKTGKRESEKDIERTLCRRVKELGGHALKYSSSTEAGYPDRLVLLPHGRVYWVETKSQGDKPRKLQTIRHDELRHLGFTVAVIDSSDKLDKFIELCRTNSTPVT